MQHLLQSIRRFLREEDGPTAVEYAAAMMLIFLAVILTVQTLGQAVSSSFNSSANSLNTVTGH